MSLEELRNRIDEVDHQLVKLLARLLHLFVPAIDHDGHSGHPGLLRVANRY